MGSTHPSIDDEQNREEHLKSLWLGLCFYYTTGSHACIAIFKKVFSPHFLPLCAADLRLRLLIWDFIPLFFTFSTIYAIIRHRMNCGGGRRYGGLCGDGQADEAETAGKEK